MKCLRDEMEIVNAYELVGSYRGAAVFVRHDRQDGQTRARTASGRPGRPTPESQSHAQHGGGGGADPAEGPRQ
jgi:hypothetical protein